jgi:hypothetical protein
MSLKKIASSSRKPRNFLQMKGIFALVLFSLGLFSGCSTMPNPAKRLVNHLSTKTSEARMRDKVEKDKFPTAQEAGLD